LKRILKFISVEDIDIGLRFREEYEDIEELQQSIKEHGVIQPIAVGDKKFLDEAQIKELGGSPEKGSYILMAGGRRTLAAKRAELETIPALIFNHVLDELELRMVEAEENLRRKNLSFTEEVALKARIHELQELKYGKKIGKSPNSPGVSISDTAHLLNVSPATMSLDVRLAGHIEKHPEIGQKAQSKKEAWKIVEDIARREAAAELARRAKLKKVPTSKDKEEKDMMDAFVLGNFFDIITKMDSGIASIVEIDPPYAINLKKVKREGKTDSYNEIDEHFYEHFMRRTFEESFRVMKDHGWMICWFGPDPWFEKIYQWIVEAGMKSKYEEGSINWNKDKTKWIKSNKGFQIRRLPAVWTKRGGQLLQPTRYLANATEWFFYARKGDPGLNKQGRINVFEYSPVAPSKKVHPTERPIEMMEDILKTFGRGGSSVVVPFAGSGNTLLAAHNLHFPVFGFDRTPEYKNAYDARIISGPSRAWKSY